jgi:hypothetical protein
MAILAGNRGGPDVQVINVTKDAICSREASLPENAAPASMDPNRFVTPVAPLPDANQAVALAAYGTASPA